MQATTSTERGLVDELRSVTWPVWLILASVAVLFVPSYVALSSGWGNDERGHAPIILAVTAWLVWSRRRALLDLPDAPAYIPGTLLLLLGCGFYVIGRSQSIDTLEVTAHLPIIAALLLLTKGWKGLRWGIFYLFFLAFVIPLPGIVIQSVTTPLKIAVSHAAEAIMSAMHYPIARDGVILYVGQYQLLVADACAGLNSIFTLEALGLLYLNLMNHSSAVRNTALAILVLPISFISNVTRVIILVLVTYYFGDEAGQGFVHGFAGMVLFGVALVLMLIVDGFVGRALARREARRAVKATPAAGAAA